MIIEIRKKLSELGIELPCVAGPVGAYVPVVQSGKLLFVSGQLPIKDGKVIVAGKLGRDVDIKQAQQAARICAINALAAIDEHLGGLEEIKRIVRLEVFVNSEPDFIDQAQVANGASNLLHDIFGQAGQHARLAVGAGQLPLNAAVELAMIVECK